MNQSIKGTHRYARACTHTHTPLPSLPCLPSGWVHKTTDLILKISSVGIDLPLYYGDNLEVLSYGIGQYAGSYFPGEGGSIILAGHNDPGYFDKLLDVKQGDMVLINTTYGDFNYKVDSFKVVNENELSAFPVQTEKELLIMYTCYPLGVGKKTERFVVYAYRVGGNNE